MRNPVSLIAPTVATLCCFLQLDARRRTRPSRSPPRAHCRGHAVIGSDIKNGTQLAIEQLGGPLTAMGFKIQLAPFDDQGNPDTGVANAKAIVSDPTVLGVSATTTRARRSLLRGYHAANLCNVSPANTNPKVTDRRYLEVNRLCGRDDLRAPWAPSSPRR